MPRNKLIKRSSSFRGPSGVSPLESTGRFQRPLTSHDRIRTLRERPASSMLEGVEWTTSDTSSRREQHHRPRWRHYFTVKSVVAPADATPSSTARDSRPIKRLFPDDEGKPFLLMAESIVTTAVEVNSSFRLSRDAESIMFGGNSRPMTPAGFEGDLSSPMSMGVPKRNQPEPTVTALDDTLPRRSFSISDLLSRGPSSDKSRRSTSFGDRFLRRRTLRISSAPMRLMEPDQPKQSIERQHDRERPAKRRESDAMSPRAPPSSGSQVSHDFHLPTPSPLSPMKPPTPPRNVSATFLAESPVIPEEGSVTPQENIPIITRPSSALRRTQHRVRHSISHSEHASTIGGSDYDNRAMSSGEDDDTDMSSETMFDSIRTRGTRSASGVNARGARIETIFDESPPHKSTQSSLQQFGGLDGPNKLLPDVQLQANTWPQTADISVPVGNTDPTQRRPATPPLPSTPPRTSHAYPGPPVSPRFHSSPPQMDRFNVQQLERQAQQQEDSDAEMWDVDDSASGNFIEASDLDDEDDIHGFERVATPLSMHRSNPMLVHTSSSNSATTTPVNLTINSQANKRDSVSRSSVFDWSEPPDAPVGSDNTPPRPKTVHGKKAPGKRGSRAGRRAPSGLHVRSQSVPVVPDLANVRKENLSAKFGTWNAGNGPTEDWDDDFDFSGPSPPRETSEELDDKRIDSGFGMHIPKSIRDQQGSMQQNRKLITDMYHYAGALRDLQRHAVYLELVDGEHKELFQLVDAIIALADEESEELGPGNFSPPSSPGFDADAFEENPNGVKDRIKQKAGRSASARYSDPPAQTSATNNKLRRKSVLPPNDSLIFMPPTVKDNAVSSNHGSSPIARSPETPKAARPRKDSVARAKLVIEHFQDRNNITHTIDETSDGTRSKVAFDTATLRNLVPFVKEVVDNAKAAIREREALHSSPNGVPLQSQPPAEPPFTTVFRELPLDGSPTNRPRRVRQVGTAPHDGVENDLTQQLKLMTVV